jgi:hypothetical protein
MAGFFAKLKAQQAEHREQGLVWVGDGGLAAYVEVRHPSARRMRRTSGPRSLAFRAGQQDGMEIILHRGVEASPVAPAGPRLLGKGDEE